MNVDSAIASGIGRTIAICASCLLALVAADACAEPLSAEDTRLLQQREFGGDQAKYAMPAMELARKLGKEASPEGLEAILQGGNRYRLHDYLYGFSFASLATYPPALEASIVRHYDNAEFQHQFLSAIAQGRPKYQSEALFKRLLGSLKSLVLEPPGSTYREERIHIAAQAVVNTNLSGIEQALFEVCPQLPHTPRATRFFNGRTSHGIVVNFLDQRKFAPMTPYLAALLDRSPGPVEGGAGFFLSVMERLDRPAATRSASRYFDRLAREPDGEAVRTELAWTLDFLRRQGMVFPVPTLVALIEGRRPAAGMSQVDVLAAAVIGALAAMQEAAAVQALVNRIGSLAKVMPHAPAAAAETGLILTALLKLEDQSLLDYDQLKKALPPQLGDRSSGLHIKLIERRKEKQGVPELIAYLAVASHAAEALRVLIEFNSVDVWRAARAGLERHHREGKLTPGWYRLAQARLDELIANPDGYFAERKSRELAGGLAREKDALARLRSEANKAKSSDPAAYVSKSREYLEGLERLRAKYPGLPASDGLRSEIVSGYLALAGYIRFVQRQPQQAIAVYQRIRPAAGGGDRQRDLVDPLGIVDLLLGDLYQFDLRDSAKAAAHYESALQQLGKAKGSDGRAESRLLPIAMKWLRHELDFLKSGKAFTGTIGREEALALIVLGMVVAGADSTAVAGVDVGDLYRDAGSPPDWSRLDRAKLRQQMERLPSSRITLINTIAPLSLMPTEDSVLRHLRRNDPSGYLSAGIMAAVHYIDHLLKAQDDPKELEQVTALVPGLLADAPGKRNVLRLASARFREESGVTVLAGTPDPRKATPELTWNLFIESLKKGDLESAYGCLTDGMRAKWVPAFSSMPPEKLRSAALSFSGFSMSMDLGAIKEAVVTRGDVAGLIYFVKEFGEWKIQEM